eukprot:PhM_4_TR16905/c0_g1_i1/m.26085
MSRKVTKFNVHKGPRQKHLNSTSFDPNRHRGAFRVDYDIAACTKHCCQHCTKVITWKIQYGKYRPLKDCRKCNKCDDKSVKEAYHNTCPSCCDRLRICAKCCQDLSNDKTRPADEDDMPGLEDEDESSVDSETEAAFWKLAEGLREREKRTAVRIAEAGRIKRALAYIEKQKTKSAREDGDEDSDEDDADVGGKEKEVASLGKAVAAMNVSAPANPDEDSDKDEII